VSPPGGPRAWFIAYAILLATLTHWPRLDVDIGRMPRPDVLAHVAAFGTWAFLAQRSGLFGPRHTSRAIALAAGASVAYAVIDEATQAIPALGRTAAWDDLAANLLGVGAGTAAAMAALLIEPDRSGDG